MQKYLYNVKCVLSYDGSLYQGFQIQHDAKTIELELKKAISVLTKSDTKLYGSGRTDKGVHAYGQVINYYTNIYIKEDKLIYALNKLLPEDIRILSVSYVDMDFHSRFSAKYKEYKYLIRYKDYSPFDVRYSYFNDKLDLALMKDAIKLFEGTHNFESFCSADVDKRKDFVKTIYSATIEKNETYYEFSFIGTGFLKYQIRRMMSLLIAIGLKKEKKEKILELFETKNHHMTSRMAPGAGLYLVRVEY